MPLTTLTAEFMLDASSHLLQEARSMCAQGQRVLWVGLPTQRNSVLQALVQDGTVIGFEFVSEQQLCYRLLSHARRLRPLKVGTERLALVGAALAEVHQGVPMPGEARLFAAAIAELKRYGLAPQDSHQLAFDSESSRLAEVHQQYERLKGDAWDYDDYRSQALHLARSGPFAAGADAILVAGYRELLPMTAELYAELANSLDVRVALPEIPPELAHGERLLLRADRRPVAPWRYRAPNEVEEARWVLRSIKEELASGTRVGDLVLVVPAAELGAYQVLAEEYDVPLMPEVPVTMTEGPAGRTLLELVNLADFTSPSALLALPGLERLAAVALERRVSGEAALLRLAASLDRQDSESDQETAAGQIDGQVDDQDQGSQVAGLEERLRDWLARLSTDSPDLPWAESLLDLLITEILPERSQDGFDAVTFRAQALQRAREAAQLGAGDAFRAWWAALLEETRMPVRERAGVALISPVLASGRHYRKAWLAGALEGAYLPTPSEDYFLPEDERGRGAGAKVPRRFRGGESQVFGELLDLADELVITYAEASQGGRNTPQVELVEYEVAQPLPPQPAGNRFELGQARTPPFDHRLEPSLVDLPAAEVQWLMRYAECPHRAWGQSLLQRTGDLPPSEAADWQQLRRELLTAGRLDASGLEQLAQQHPDHAAWLRQHSELLEQLHYGLYLPRGRSLRARVDASGRLDGTVSLFRFCAPGSARNAEEATLMLSNRSAERWLAAYLLEDADRPQERVRLYAWPVGGAPVEAGVPGGQSINERWLRRGLGQLDDQHQRMLEGDIAPTPGFLQCRNCLVADMCRKAML